MTKIEMIRKMSDKLNWTNNQLNNRAKNTLANVEKAYDYYIKSNQTKEDQAFVMSVLAVW